MCSRYSMTSPPEAVRSYFATVNLPNFPPRYNIAPTQTIPVVRLNEAGERELVFMRWGLLPSWVKDAKSFGTLINARCETVCEKPAFRAAMRQRRCLVPADGFYEWTGEKGRRRPYFVSRRDGGLLAFAGLWERWRDPQGQDVLSTVIITTPSNRTVGVLHDRMPAILPPESFADWLEAGRVPADVACAFLRPAPEDLLRLVEVKPKINNSKVDHPGIRESVQGELF